MHRPAAPRQQVSLTARQVWLMPLVGAVLQCQQGVQGTAAGAAAGGGGGAVADEPRPQPRGAAAGGAPQRRRQSLSVGAAQRLDTRGLACRQQQGSMCRPLAASITEAPGGVMQPAGLSWCVYRVCITPMAIRMDRLLMGGLDSCTEAHMWHRHVHMRRAVVLCSSVNSQVRA